MNAAFATPVSIPRSRAARGVHPVCPAMAAHATTPFTLPNGRGDTLHGLVRTRGDAVPSRSQPCLVLLHGFLDSAASPFLTAISTSLLASTSPADLYATVQFSFTGNPPSSGETLYGNYTSDLLDTVAVTSYLRTQKLTPVAILGHSKGAYSALLQCTCGAPHEPIRTIINVAGRFDMTRGIIARLSAETLSAVDAHGTARSSGARGRDFTVTRACLAERRGLDMGAVAARVGAAARVVTIHGRADRAVPCEDAAAFREAGRWETVVVEGAGHTFGGREAEVAAIVARFCGWREGGDGGV